MSQFFSGKRFSLLLNKYIRDNRQSLVGAAVIVLACQLLFAVFIIYPSLPSTVMSGRVALYMIQGCLFWSYFTWQQTNEINTKEKAMSLCLLPASLFEKMFLLWLITGLGFFCYFNLSFYLIDRCGTFYVNHHQWTANELRQIREWGMPLTIQPFDFTVIKDYYYCLFLSPLVLLCSFTFKRYTIVFTLLTIGLFVLCLLILNGSHIHSLINEKDIGSKFPLGNIIVHHRGSEYQDIVPPEPIGILLRWGVTALLIFLWYATAYFRLKEREV